MPYGQPAQLANLRPAWEKGRMPPTSRRSRDADRALRMARRHTVEAIETAIKCMRDETASWPERMAGVKVILQEGLPKKRDLIEDSITGNSNAFIEVRPGTFSVSFDAE